MKTFLLLVSLSVLTLLPVNRKPAQVGPAPDGGYLVPTQQRIRPAGVAVSFLGRPVDLTLSPDRKTVYVKDNRGLVVIDAETWKIRQELKYPEGGSSMHGLAVSRDGTRLYATTAQDMLWEAKAQTGGALEWGRKIALPGPGGKGASPACGLAFSPDERLLYVCLSLNNTLGVVDLSEGRLVREIPVGVAPFDLELSRDGKTAYVSNWGGRRPKEGERTAKSAETDTLVDERGVASSGTVSFIHLETGKEEAQIETGLHPSDLTLNADGSRLYVANANSDTVSVIDTRTARQKEVIPVRPDASLPFGSMPNALALSADEKTLFAAVGGNNAVAVISLREGGSVVQGFIPAGWYPGAVATDGKRLYVANIKGIGSRTQDPQQRGWQVYRYAGTVNRVEIPSPDTLRRYTAQVRADGRVPQMLRAWERGRSGRKPVPVPARVGEPSVFEHVVYIIKENRTYDQVFGDLPQGNGDPQLCIFGREVTPNHHALAEQFVLLDNYYCNGVLSADGHSWATEGNVTDHLEKSFGGFTRSYTFGDDPLTYSSTGFIWDNVLAAGLSFRNYGEMDYAEPIPASATFKEIYDDFTQKTGKIRFSQKIGIEKLNRYSCPDYPGWNMRIPDVLRADRFLKELAEYEKNGGLPNLIILYLPQDHASGTTPGMPTPRAHVADNDLALGRIVEALSKSRFWSRTCIFVNEDDPQDGFDHVDGHRSLCLVISPYTRRKAVISEFYNQTSVLHTIQRILGLPAMNQMDGAASLMTACFTDKPDFTPYTCLPNRVPLDELNPPLSSLRGKQRYWAQQSQQIPWHIVDGAEEDTLNRILWHAVRGVDAPYPSHYAGAHGKGLKALNLRLNPAADDD
jgi:YVTN family beta-propeller protein